MPEIHTDPCRQDAAIKVLTNSIDAINRTLLQMAEGQSEMVELIRSDAAQGSLNTAIQRQIEALEMANNTVFNRLHTLEAERLPAIEVKLEGIATKIGVFCGLGVMAGTGIVTAILHVLKLA